MSKPNPVFAYVQQGGSRRGFKYHAEALEHTSPEWLLKLSKS